MLHHELAPPTDVTDAATHGHEKGTADEHVEVVPTSEDGNVLVSKYACECPPDHRDSYAGD